MQTRNLLFLFSLIGLVACGGGGGDSAGNPQTPSAPGGYDPTLAEQTITPEELAVVNEIVDTSTVTVEGDVAIASQDLVVKGNLIIK